jgi:hypothetical protein
MSPSRSARRRAHPRAALLAPVILVALTAVAMAAATPEEPLPAQVEELIRQGNELRRDGKDHAAVGLFQKAYDLQRSPRTAGQLGLAESALGYWMAAERHLGEALAAPRHPWMEKNKEKIEKAMAHVQSYIAEIEVTGPAGAELLVNTRPVGTLPLQQPVRVPEGVLQLVLRAPGYEEGSRNVRVSGGKKETIRLTLERAQAPAAPNLAGGGAAAAPTARGSELGMGMTSRPVKDEGGGPAWVRPAAWAAAAGAAVALSVGTYGVFRQRSKRDEFDGYTGPPPGNAMCSTSANMQGGAECAALYKEAQNAANLAIGGFIAGGVLAGAAITGFLLSGGDTNRDHASSGGGTWQLQLGPHRAQAGYAVRF